MKELIIAFCFVLICTITDIRTKKIYGEWIGVFCFTGILYCLYMEKSVQSVVYSVIPGIILLIISVISKEAIGKGDGLMVINLGIIMGPEKIIGILMISLITCAVASLVMIVAKKVSKNYEIPFAPFLMIALMFITFF
ncbi:MAG: prepilin peptidase [Lachnospiraceae bacterium]|nr:prepilin peptidase [Lachnospiraceae bacterium]